MCLIILPGARWEAPVRFCEMKTPSAAACHGWSSVEAIFIKRGISTDLKNKLGQSRGQLHSFQQGGMKQRELPTGSRGKHRNAGGVKPQETGGQTIRRRRGCPELQKGGVPGGVPTWTAGLSRSAPSLPELGPQNCAALGSHTRCTSRAASPCQRHTAPWL